MHQEKLKKRQLLRSLLKSNYLPLEEQLPRLTAAPFSIQPDPQQLTAFNALTGWRDASHLAPTWLQMSALPTYLNLITSPGFPFSPLGLVHLENNIVLQDMLPVDANYHISCSINYYQQHLKGMVFRASVEASADNQSVYRADARFLALIKAVAQDPARKARKSHPEIHHDTEQSWQLETDIGRRYASLSGDYNLIHINPYTAKLFGFKRHIAHGMYLQARAMSELLATGVAGKSAFPLNIATAFKKPVFLPAEVVLGYSFQENGIKFDLYRGTDLHATGTVF